MLRTEFVNPVRYSEKVGEDAFNFVRLAALALGQVNPKGDLYGGKALAAGETLAAAANVTLAILARVDHGGSANLAFGAGIAGRTVYAITQGPALGGQPRPRGGLSLRPRYAGLRWFGATESHQSSLLSSSSLRKVRIFFQLGTLA